ncbi:MAG TPA: DUF86 domain-containing protein [Methanotrichaceae archaeon]|nr:DUF86 domain-containing protein [Methanotrichaceae archaeon]
MKGERRYLDFLQDILDNLEKSEQFTDGMSFEKFLLDEKTCYSVICALEIVGEAVKNIPPVVRRRHPQVPWKSMAGMRDRLIHGYFGVDMEIVWKTAREFAPEMRLQIKAILDNEHLKTKENEE